MDFGMGRIGNCRGALIQHHLHRCANDLHFLHGEAVATSNVTMKTCRHNVIPRMAAIIIDSIQAARCRYRTTIMARHDNQSDNIIRRQIAFVNALISLPKRNGASLVSSTIAILSRATFDFLFWRKSRPSFFSAITSDLSGSMTRTALIADTERPTPISNKIFCRSRHRNITSIASSTLIGRLAILPHLQRMGHVPPFVNPTTAKEPP